MKEEKMESKYMFIYVGIGLLVAVPLRFFLNPGLEFWRALYRPVMCGAFILILLGRYLYQSDFFPLKVMGCFFLKFGSFCVGVFAVCVFSSIG